MVCVCGASCDGCTYRDKECSGGCTALQGRVFWTKHINADVCPVYQCVADNGYKNCGDCAKLPCETWFNLKDPEISSQEHQKSINDRVAKLKSLQA